MGSLRADKTSENHAADLFVSSVNYFEIIGGGLFRVTFNVNKTNATGHLQPQPADWALVMPLSSLPDAIGKAIAISARKVFADEDGAITLMQ